MKKTPLICGLIAILALLPAASAGYNDFSLSFGSWQNYWNGYQWVTPGYWSYPYYGYYGYYGYAPTYYAQAYPDYVYPAVQQHTTNIVYVQQSQPYQDTSSVVYQSPSDTGYSQSSQVSAQVRCGDGWCSSGETKENCPGDCSPAPYCGDGACSNGETSSSCPYDCKAAVQVSNSYCGDGRCSSSETKYTCPDDCGPAPYCGDGTCSGAETRYNCPEDCGLAPYCGDGKCDKAETKYNCARDCGLPDYCGDGSCNGVETKYSCPRDCGLPSCVAPKGSEGDKTCDDRQILKCESGLWRFEKSVQCCDDSDCPSTGAYECSHNVCQRVGLCGDGLCTDGEKPANCPADCGSLFPLCNTCQIQRAYCGDGICNDDETQRSCPQDCGQVRIPYCGDGVCDLKTENQANCPQDCGRQIRHSLLLTASDECFEIEQGKSMAFRIILINAGEAFEELSMRASGQGAAWASLPASIVLAPNGSRVVEIVVNVPLNAGPGLYDINVNARNEEVSGSAVLHVDVRLPSTGSIIVTNQTTTTGAGPTGGFVLGELKVPDWAAAMIIALVVACIILVLLIRRQNGLDVDTRLLSISKKVKEPVLTPDGGIRSGLFSNQGFGSSRDGRFRRFYLKD